MSYSALQALPVVLAGLFQKHANEGSLAPFFAIAPLHTNRGSNGTYQVLRTRLGYDAQKGNVDFVGGASTRDVSTLDLDEMAFVHDKAISNWVRVDDRMKEALEATNPGLSLQQTSVQYVSNAVAGFLNTRLQAQVATLTQYGETLDLSDASFDLVAYLAAFADDQALRAGDDNSPNVLAFGPQVHRKLLELTQVQGAGKNLGTANPPVGIVQVPGNKVAPAIRAVCNEVGIEPILVRDSYISKAGTPTWAFGASDAFIGRAAPGEAPSCFKTFTPYASLVDIITGRLQPPQLPGDAYAMRTEYALETVDPALGRKLDVKLSS